MSKESSKPVKGLTRNRISPSIELVETRRNAGGREANEERGRGGTKGMSVSKIRNDAIGVDARRRWS